MNDKKTEKILIFGTHGPEDPERASLPFVVGNAALAMEVQVTVFLQGMGVLLAKKGCLEHVFVAGFPPLKELIKIFIEQGGTLLICLPCIQEREITPDMLVEIAQPVKSARAVIEILEANNVVSY